jgi:hypothetical protein
MAQSFTDTELPKVVSYDAYHLRDDPNLPKFGPIHHLSQEMLFVTAPVVLLWLFIALSDAAS